MQSPKTPCEVTAMRNIPYHEGISSLMWACLRTHPDIAFAVMTLSRFSTDPGDAHWLAVKRVLRYLNGIKNLTSPLAEELESLWDMPVQMGAWLRIEKPFLDVLFYSMEELSHGPARSKKLSLYRLPRANTSQQLTQLKKRSGSALFYPNSMARYPILQPYSPTISQPSHLPRTISIMPKRNTSTCNSILSDG